ncbi:hypothetical protein KKF34_13540 [Myxococcota bacterium]|nr:hypothetical protein [Myxococcota bacterium]MBU1380557.1 hypothetical protein [Myxococcota bacterium]MBU1497893.1 hypothetical protein [Myxococcota bacterium]
MFEISEFELFSREKWSDMVYNKDRLKVKQKLITIGKQVITNLGESGADLQMETGSEYPAIWNKRKVDRLELVFIRPVEERKLLSKAFSREIPMAVSVQNPSDIYMNISLGLIIDKDGIKVGIQIPWLAFADRETLNNIVSDTLQFSELVNIVNQSTEISFVSPSLSIPCSSISSEILKNSLEQLSSGTTDDYRVSLGFFRIFSIAECSSENIFDEITHVLSSLISLFKFLSWTSVRDRIGVKGLIVQIEKTLQKEKEDREQEELKKQEIKTQAAKPADKPIVKPAEKPAAKPAERSNPRPQSNTYRQSRPNSPEKTQQKPQTQVDNKKKTQPKQPKNPFSVGDSVIIRDGLLMGKKGKITSISGNKCTVDIGNLQATFDISGISIAK